MYIFENVWQKDSPTKKEVIEFWLQEGVLPSEEEAIKRSDQLIFVARDNTNKVIGVCTAYINYIPHLLNHFYFYRSYITQEHRTNILGPRLFIKSHSILNKIFQQEQEKKTIGIIMEIENKQLASHHKAIWSGFGVQSIFIGVNQRGIAMRVTYFDDAYIS